MARSFAVDFFVFQTKFVLIQSNKPRKGFKLTLFSRYKTFLTHFEDNFLLNKEISTLRKYAGIICWRPLDTLL